MKPILLTESRHAHHLRPPDQLDNLLNYAKNLEKGEIDVSIVENWDSKPFFDYLSFGYRQRKLSSTNYLSIDLTCVNGSIHPHEDNGYGLTAAWLLYEEDSAFMDPVLFTKQGYIKLQTGDIFIFNASEEHAWLCNGACVLLMAAISKIKPKKLETK